MAFTITVNNYSLTGAYIRVRRVLHDSTPENYLSEGRITRRDRAKLVSTEYNPKKIVIEGIILGDTQEALEDNIDTFKKNVYKSEVNLDISYGTKTRRYVVTPTMITVERDNYNLRFAPFTLELMAINPAGLSTQSHTSVWTNVDAGTWTSNMYFTGTMYPEPVTTIRVLQATMFSAIQMRNTYRNDTITVDGLFSANDVIVIDHSQRKVTRNTVARDYSGVFPQFQTGDNTIYFTLEAGAWLVDIEIAFTPRWL